MKKTTSGILDESLFKYLDIRPASNARFIIITINDFDFLLFTSKHLYYYKKFKKNCKYM